MAYDPNDPEDKKIVAKLVTDALSEAKTEHEAELKGLKDSNTKLLADMKKLQKEGGTVEELAALRAEHEEIQVKFKEAEKALKKATKDLETSQTEHANESKFTENLIIDGGLTEALSSAKVAAEFLPAVKALLRPQVALKVDTDGRRAVVGDKSLDDFVKEWSQGDQGKAFIAAPSNGGAGAPGGRAGGAAGGKSMLRSAFDQLNASNPAGAMKFIQEGGSVADAAAA